MDKLRVLCLEDNPLHRKIITGVIKQMGHKVYETSRIEEAERILKSDKIDCFVTDYALRHNNMNGLDFYRKIRNEGFQCPVIFVTSEVEVLFAIADEDERTMVIIKENSFDEELKCTIHNVFAMHITEAGES